MRTLTLAIGDALSRIGRWLAWPGNAISNLGVWISNLYCPCELCNPGSTPSPTGEL